MKYLYAALVALLCSGGKAVAQLAFEAGMSVGARSVQDATGGFIDVLENKFKSNFVKSAGIRFYNIGEYGQDCFGIPLLAQYKIDISRRFALRFAAGGGIKFNTGFAPGDNWVGSMQPLTEFSTGCMFDKKWTAAIKYTQSFEAYSIHAVQMDARILLGKPTPTQAQLMAKAKAREIQQEKNRQWETAADKEPGKNPRMEAGINVGWGYTFNEDTPSIKQDALAAMNVFDITFDRNRIIAPVLGARVCFNRAAYSSLAVATYVGGKAEVAMSPNVSARASLGMSVIAELSDNGYRPGRGFAPGVYGQFNFAPEAGAGVYLWHRIYAGVKWWQPLRKYYRIPDYEYNVRAIMLELKLRMGWLR